MQLNVDGLRALAAGEFRAARTAFGAAADLDPAAPALWLNVAKAARLLGDDRDEHSALDRVLALDARDLTALIRKAELCQRCGEVAEATRLWSGVLQIAPPAAERSPALAALLTEAQAFVAERTAAFTVELDRGLAGTGVDAAERRRFDAAVDAATGRRRIYANECAGMHVPFLPADEFFDRAHFPWLAAIEAETPAIRAELAALLADGAPGLQPYVAMQPGVPVNKWTPLDGSLDWGAYYLWKYGAPVADALARCPATAAALAALPKADLPGRAPTAFFSLLRPGTHIPPHTGVSNARAIVHLPLIVPPRCSLRVGGEVRSWTEGEALVFDDTIEHEAWNDSSKLRAVLIFDVWNPYLSATERDLLRRFFDIADRSGFYPPSDD